MTDNIKPQEPLKTLREHGLAIVTKGERMGRFVRLIRKSIYIRRRIIWAVEFNQKRHGDESNPMFNEDMLVCVATQFEPAILPENGDKCILIGDSEYTDNWRMIVISVERTASIAFWRNCFSVLAVL